MQRLQSRTSRAVEQRDAADEGRLEACGSIIVGKAIVNQGKVVRPSQLIASVRQTPRMKGEGTHRLHGRLHGQGGQD